MSVYNTRGPYLLQASVAVETPAFVGSFSDITVVVELAGPLHANLGMDK